MSASYWTIPAWHHKQACELFHHYMIGQNFKGAAYVLFRLIHRKSGVFSYNTPEITCNASNAYTPPKRGLQQL